MLAAQLILSSSSSTSMQHGSVCKKIRPSSGSQPDFERTAADFARHLHHGVVLNDFAILELGHPDLIHPLGLEHLASSALMTWPLANNFFLPARKMVQQRTLPADCFTSIV